MSVYDNPRVCPKCHRLLSKKKRDRHEQNERCGIGRKE